MRSFPEFGPKWFGCFSGVTCLVLLLSSSSLWAEETIEDPDPAPIPTEEVEGREWSFRVSAYTYFLPDDSDYFQPTFTADYDWFHFESRYNYLARDTLTTWFGASFSLGEDLVFAFTPMLGGAFGDTTGFLLGYEGSLSWWKLTLYSEGEYLFDDRSSSDNYFYSWSEFTLAPTDWVHFGLATQHTIPAEGEDDFQPGLMVGFNYKMVGVSGYVFNFNEDDPTYVFYFQIEF